MIIYQAIPTKIYPSITNTFSEQYSNYISTSYNYNEIWQIPNLTPFKEAVGLVSQTIKYPDSFSLPRNIKDVLSKNNLINIKFFDHNKKIRISERKIDFLHGLFPSTKFKKFKKEDNDFSFTFIEHPVDAIYRLFYYLTSKATRSSVDGAVESIINNFFDKYARIKNSYEFTGKEWHYTHFLNKHNFSIESFIDHIIDNNINLVSDLFDFPVYLFDEALGKITNMRNIHDFYGISSNKETIIKSLSLLNKKFKIKNIKLDLDINSVIENYKNSDYNNLDVSYRKKDLEVLLKDDILMYEEKLNYVIENW